MTLSAPIKTNGYQDAAAVQLSAFSALMFSYPLEKIVESKLVNSLSFSGNIARCWKGIHISMLYLPLYPLGYSVKRLAFDCLKANFSSGSNSFQEKGLSAASAFAGGSVSGPICKIIQKATENEESRKRPIKTLIGAIKSLGVRGVFAGAIPMSFRNGISAIGLFWLYPELKSNFRGKFNSESHAAQMSCIALSAIPSAGLAWCVTVPHDNAWMSYAGRTNQFSLISSIKQIYSQNGFRGLYAKGRSRYVAALVEMIVFNEILRRVYLPFFRQNKTI